MQIRIAITRFPYESQLGGEELHTLQVAKHWRKRGHYVKLYSSCPVLINLFRKHKIPTKKFKLAKPPVTKLRLLTFGLAYPVYLYRAYRLNQKLKKDKINRVYMLSFTEKLLLPILLAKNIKYFFVEHARIGRWFTSNPWKYLYYFLASRGKVVTVSDLMAKALRWKPTVVIPNGVHTEKFAIIPGAIKNYGPRIISTIGRLTPDKGIEDYLEFLKLLADSGDLNWRAEIVGDGPLKSQIEAKIKDYGFAAKIKLRTKLDRNEIASLLANTDVFCLLSPLPDPFGLVVAEAMAAGAAPIATNVCGIKAYSKLITTVPAGKPKAVLAAYKEISKQNLPRGRYRKEAEKRLSIKPMLDRFNRLIK